MPKRTVPPKEQLSVWSRLRVQVSPNRQREIVALLLAALGALTLLSLLGFAGAVTEVWANLLRQFTGWGAYLIAVALLFGSFSLLRREENVFDEFPIAWGRIVSFEILFGALMGLIHLAVAADDRAAADLAARGDGGGYLGWAIASVASRVGGPTIGAVLLIACAAIAFRFLVDLTPLALFAMRILESRRPQPVSSVRPRSVSRLLPPVDGGSQPIQPPLPLPVAPKSATGLLEPARPAAVAPAPPSTVARRPIFGLRLDRSEKKSKSGPLAPAYDPLLAVARVKREKRSRHLPGMEMLQASAEAGYAQTTAEQKKHVIEETLEQFGIPAKVVEINAGPTITQFGVEPGFVERRGLDGAVRYRKVPVSRIQSLSNDLALALAASPIRIEAPVPGRSVVGIEVPNEHISVVSLRGVMESEAYKKLRAKASLPIALGRDVSGSPTLADLGVMPHLLIAGATGSGKSVCINALIACMLCTHSPDDLRMVMVDPKRVELVNFNGIPHLIGPVITEISHVVPALRWATGLMDLRFQTFSKAGTRNIEAYNAKMDKAGGNRLPYLLIIIDELADLMLAAPEETEKLITRLAQMARATGIHLVLATQRPSVDVVTGLIKANFPARISFAVTSSVDSRVVLDTPGAEKLLGRGDMLYMAPDSSKLVRLQGCFVSDEELSRLSNYWRNLREEFDWIEKAPWDLQERAADDGRGADELIEAATQLLRGQDRASISLLQRKLGIGYPRAARLMDQLEERGLVGPDEGSAKGRAIHIPDNSKRRK